MRPRVYPSGAIDSAIPNTFIPQIGKFPTIILWAVAAVAIVWFIWNKTTFGKTCMRWWKPGSGSSIRYLCI